MQPKLPKTNINEMPGVTLNFSLNFIKFQNVFSFFLLRIVFITINKMGNVNTS
mgnify:CR=1 FL=1